jgi:hypothetical protein
MGPKIGFEAAEVVMNSDGCGREFSLLRIRRLNVN